MNKIISSVAACVFLLGATPAFANNGDVILNFDTSALTAKGLSSLAFYYDGKFDNSGFYFENQQDVIRNSTVVLSHDNIGVTLEDDDLIGSTGKWTFTNEINPGDLSKPVCNLKRDFQPGTYNVTLGTEPLYNKNLHMKIGYAITCRVNMQ